jgi:hypothetical protein
MRIYCRILTYLHLQIYWYSPGVYNWMPENFATLFFHVLSDHLLRITYEYYIIFEKKSWFPNVSKRTVSLWIILCWEQLRSLAIACDSPQTDSSSFNAFKRQPTSIDISRSVPHVTSATWRRHLPTDAAFSGHQPTHCNWTVTVLVCTQIFHPGIFLKRRLSWLKSLMIFVSASSKVIWYYFATYSVRLFQIFDSQSPESALNVTYEAKITSLTKCTTSQDGLNQRLCKLRLSYLHEFSFRPLFHFRMYLMDFEKL